MELIDRLKNCHYSADVALLTNEAADTLESQDKAIAELVEGLKQAKDYADHCRQCARLHPDHFKIPCDALNSLIAKHRPN